MTKATRREFTLGLTGAAAAMALGRGRSEAAERAPSTFGGVQVGVQSYTFRKFDVDRMIQAMNDVGLTSVELWDGHLDPKTASDADFKAMRGKFDAAGIKISAYCVNFKPETTDELLERGFLGAKLLGTDVMTSSVQKPIVPRLDAWCVKHKIRLGLHNHQYPKSKGDTSMEFQHPEDFDEALKGRSEYLSINLDVGHFHAAGHDPVAFLRSHAPRIVSVHVKDRDKDEERSIRRFGEGVTPIKEVAKTLREIKFRYAANLEYEIEANDPTEAVRHALAYFKAALLA